MTNYNKFSRALFLLSACFFVSAAYAEIRTVPHFDESYWESATKPKDQEEKIILERFLPGRAVRNPYFTVENMSFNRRPHRNGKGDYLSVRFDIFNNKIKPFEGYMFVVASLEQRYKKGPHYYILINNISPAPDGSDKEFRITRGFFPAYAKTIASSVESTGRKAIGALTKQELLKSSADDPTTGIPIYIKDHLQVEIKHYMPYSREQKFFNTVTILIYGKKKEKMIKDELTEDKTKYVAYETDEKGRPTEYKIGEYMPLLYLNRIHLQGNRY